VAIDIGYLRWNPTRAMVATVRLSLGHTGPWVIPAMETSADD